MAVLGDSATSQLDELERNEVQLLHRGMMSAVLSAITERVGRPNGVDDPRWLEVDRLQRACHASCRRADPDTREYHLRVYASRLAEVMGDA